MDYTALFNLMKPIAAQAARDVLRTAGVFLLAHGVLQNDAGTTAFIGAGMTIAGLIWGWFTTSGYIQLTGLLKKLTATHTPKAAVTAATALPKAAAVDTIAKKEIATDAVAKS